MRVVQIIDALYYGGAQKMQVMLAQAMRQRNVELTVLSLQDDTQGTSTLADLESLGVRVCFYPAKKLLDPVRIWQIVRFLRREQFDIVHTHLTYANIIGTLTGRLAGIPVIASLRNESVDHHPIRTGLESWLLRHWASQVMAVGYATATAHRKRLGGRQIQAVPNAMMLLPTLSEADRTAIRAQLINDPTQPLIISVGRLNPQKGYSDLLNAFADLHRTHPAATLVIAGSGNLHAALAAQIRALNLEKQAILLGPRNDVPRLLAASDIFVSSSHWEGLPVAVLEAMAAGLPVVATKVSDVPRVVVEGTGLIVPPHEPAALAKALRSLLDSPARMRLIGAAARDHIARNYNLNTWGDRMMALYESVVDSPARLKPQEVRQG